jgi:antirestriction protein ArdC
VAQALDTLAEAIERGESEQLKAYLGTLARFHQYSLSNVFLIAVQRPNATRVAGFRTWQKLGRYVKKGEKGIHILAPIVWRRKREEAREESRGDGEEDEVVRFRSVCVFDVAQTEGRPLAEFAQARGEPGKHTSRLMQFAAEQGIEVEFSDALVSAHGLSSGGKILVRKGLPAAEEFSVLAHELLHKAEEEQPSSRTVRETEAEAVAFVVCQAIGLEAINAAADYTHLYQGSKETLLESLQRIRQAAAEIIGAITKKESAEVRTGAAVGWTPDPGARQCTPRYDGSLPARSELVK